MIDGFASYGPNCQLCSKSFVLFQFARYFCRYLRLLSELKMCAKSSDVEDYFDIKLKQKL